ncbi:hypothetical protein ACQPZ2_30740 [Nocardia pseudovaccinii]|uniref:hypothetical protein n=1 Tax=Nocardia pseudovaccinii TaxID=189540 RepID=UPI003D8E6ADE
MATRDFPNSTHAHTADKPSATCDRGTARPEHQLAQLDVARLLRAELEAARRPPADGATGA